MDNPPGLPTPRRIKKFGWIPDLPDKRDLMFSAPLEALGALPAHVDLTQGCPPVYDQGELGSCTANAIAAAVEFDRRKEGIQDWVPSRLFIYYNEREIGRASCRERVSISVVGVSLKQK